MIANRPEFTRCTSLALLTAGAWALAPAANAQTPSPAMSFFATSVGNGASGGDYGGLAGADARCQSLADAVGADDRTWVAYLSTAPIEGFGGALVHARDRIGAGPWFNHDGDAVASDLASLHADGIDPVLVVTEHGSAVPGIEHDILTGSFADGTARTSFPGNPAAPPPTCFNWTTNDSNTFTWVGHADWDPGDSWNDSHGTQCDEAGLNATAGSGRIYCFATDGSPPPLAGDACDDARVIPGGGPFPVRNDLDTSEASSDVSDPVASCGPGGAGASVWFEFTPFASGTATFDTTGSAYGAVISAWPASEGCGALATELGCVDDSAGAGAALELDVEGAETVLLQLADRDGNLGGALSMAVTLVTEAGPPSLSFFVTSIGNGAAGGNYGGLAGADARCQSLAATAGVGEGTWRAYLSTAPIVDFGGELVHARDRIGPGPWYNFDVELVAKSVADLHADGLDPALGLDETGSAVPSSEHDILTGSLPDGMARTEFPGNPFAPAPNCFNWTSNDSESYTWVGHSDEASEWSSSHETTCSEAGLGSTAGSGRLYCFRADPVPEPGGVALASCALATLGVLRARQARRAAATRAASRSPDR